MLMELLIIFYSVFNEDLVSLFPDAVTSTSYTITFQMFMVVLLPKYQRLKMKKIIITRTYTQTVLHQQQARTATSKLFFPYIPGYHLAPRVLFVM